MKRFASLVAIGAIALVSHPVSAQTCTPLRAVGGNGTRVEKTISVPGAGPITRDNWNTDFVVPAGAAYSAYTATITPRNKGTYSVQMNLKYPNGTVDKVYDQKIELAERKPLNIRGSSRISGKPYQINLSVGGVEVVGNTYTAAVSACR
jgi:hypothetical protein